MCVLELVTLLSWKPLTNRVVPHICARAYCCAIKELLGGDRRIKRFL